MAITDWKTKYKELRCECQNAWSWVRKLPEYQADYSAAKNMPPKPYYIPPGSTVLTAPPQPKDEYAEGLRKKWGFYPLIDPAKKMPSDFFAQITDLFSLHVVGVRHGSGFYDGFNYGSLCNANGKLRKYTELQALPERVLLSIDPKAPIQPSLDYIGEFLGLVKRQYRIKVGRPRSDWLCKKYQAGVLKNLGWASKQIRASITPPGWNLRTDDDRRQCIARIIKESKKVFK